MPTAAARWIAIWLPFLRASEAGLWLFSVTEKEVVAVPRPAILIEDDRLHSAAGPAVSWPHGDSYWFWHGVQVPGLVIDHPEQITVAMVAEERNAEIRRIMVERYPGGAGKYLTDAGAKVIDRSDPDHYVMGVRGGRLLWREMPDDEPLVMVECVNSSPEPDGHFKIYWLRVHPQCRPLVLRPGDPLGEPQALTVHNAIASTFGMRGEDYRPVVET